MFARITVGIFRRWQAKKKIAALVIWSHGKHTETAVLRDDSGSAYQIALHASGFYFRPSLTVSEYLPDSMRVIHQHSFYTTVFSLTRDLDRALDQVFAWISENKAKRLSQDEEMKLIESMVQKAKEPNQPLQRNASTGSVSNFQSPARRG